MTVFTRKFNCLWIILSLLLTFTFQVSAQTTVSGPQSGVWDLEGSPYMVVNEDISVQLGDSLIIKPGVSVIFYQEREFEIFGTLITQGAPGDSVVFTSPAGGVPGIWSGLKFTGYSSSGSVLQCTIIEWGIRNIWIDGSSPKFYGIHCHGSERYGIYVEDGLPEFHVFQISNIYNFAGNHSVNATGGNPYFEYGKINHTNSDGNCMQFLQTCRPTVLHCQMQGSTENGIYGNEIPEGIFQYNTVSNVTLRGYYLHNCNNVNLSYNLAQTTNGSGIYVYNGSSIQVYCNTVMDSNHDGILLSGTSLNVDYHSNIVSSCDLYGINASGGATVWSTYSCYYNNGSGSYGGNAQAGAGDIEQDPRFISPWTNDFRLQPQSPCIDTGNPAQAIYMDPDGTRLDMGAFFYNQNNAPDIISSSPDNHLLSGYSWGNEINFAVQASDREEHDIMYRWYDRGILISETNQANVVVTHERTDSIWVEVDDGFYEGMTRVSWIFDAVDVTEDHSDLIPENFEIISAYPNPFNPATQVKVAINARGTMKYQVYDILGRQILHNKRMVNPGMESINIAPNGWASGVYFVKVELNGKTDIGKLIYSK